MLLTSGVVFAEECLLASHLPMENLKQVLSLLACLLMPPACVLTESLYIPCYVVRLLTHFPLGYDPTNTDWGNMYIMLCGFDAGHSACP